MLSNPKITLATYSRKTNFGLLRVYCALFMTINKNNGAAMRPTPPENLISYNGNLKRHKHINGDMVNCHKDQRNNF